MIILILIVLFILFSYYDYTYGGKKSPIHNILFTENLEPYYPQWCENHISPIFEKNINNAEIHDIVPEFNNLELYKANVFKLFYHNVNRYNFLICNCYGNLYAALKFIKNQNITSPIVLIEPTGYLGPLIHKITGLQIHYYSNYCFENTKKCVYGGKLPVSADFKKLRGNILINFALWFSTKNLHEIHKNAYFTAAYNEFLINELNAPAYLCLYIATLNNTKFNIPQGIKRIIPFYYPGYTPLFLIEKPYNATHNSIFMPTDLSNIAANLHLFNYCKRNSSNFDIKYAKYVLNIYSKHKKTILDTLGPLPPNTQYSFIPTDIKKYTYITSDYNSVLNTEYLLDFKSSIIDILNPPIIMQGNIVLEYNLLTLKRGIIDLKYIKYFNCADYYPYLVGTGEFLLTKIPKALNGKPGIKLVKDIQEAVKLSRKYEFIDSNFNNTNLIKNAVENLKKHAQNITVKPYIYTEYIPGLIIILKQVFPNSEIITTVEELSRYNPELITYWNITT